MSSKTNNVQYIDKTRIFNKYELTPIIESSDILDDFYRDTLKNFEPDTPTFAHEEKRKNTDSVSKIKLREFGRRAPLEPFVADLFLGDTTPDPRSISYEPNMGNYQKQMWHRKDNFKKSFKNDADYSIHEAGISEGQMDANKKATYKGLKNRYKNFEESTDAWAPSFIADGNKKSKVNNTELDDEPIDLQDVENIKYRRDHVTDLSLKSLPIGWDSVPDHKIKIANYTKLLKSKNLNDIDVTKNRNKQTADGKMTETSDVENNLASQLSLITSNFINKKKDNFISGKDTKFKNSSETQVRSINDTKEYFKNKELENMEFTQKKQALNEAFTTLYKTNDIKSDIRKNVSEFFINEKELAKGNNKEQNNYTTKDKKDLITDILHKSLMSNNSSFLNKGNNKSTYINKSRDISNDANQSKFILTSNIINNDQLNKTKNYEVINYKLAINQDTFDNYSNVKSGIDSTIYIIDNEKELEQRNIGPQNNDPLSSENFITDTEFFSSGINNMAAGTVGVMGNKYMFNKKEYEKSILDTSINDSATFNKKTRIH
jgi:hypothetical protein